MGKRKKGRKLRYAAELKRAIAAPVWAILRKFGRHRVHRWRLNPQARRHWRAKKIKR